MRFGLGAGADGDGVQRAHRRACRAWRQRRARHRHFPPANAERGCFSASQSQSGVRRRAVIRGHRRPCTRCAAVGAWRQITRAYETPVAILSMPVGCCARAVIVAQRELSGDVIFQRRAHAERAAARYDLSLPRRACDARSSGRGRREPWRVGCLSPRTACPMAAVSVPPPSLRRSRADVAIVASRSLECEASSSGPTAAAHLVRCGRGEKADGEGVRGAHRHPQHAHRLLCTCGHRPLAWAKRACRTASSRAREA